MLADSAGYCGLQVESNSIPLRPHHQSVQSLCKTDLYAAWNAMMRTPRFVHPKFHHHGIGERSTLPEQEVVSTNAPYLEETSGETIVWRQFMDQVCDVTYRADSKRLGEKNLHSNFGEFRHYIVEKFSYNLAKRSSGLDPADVSAIRFRLCNTGVILCLTYGYFLFSSLVAFLCLLHYTY